VESPLFWSDVYCEINQQSKVRSQYYFGLDVYNFEFIYQTNESGIKSPGKATFGGIWVTEDEPTVSFYFSLFNSIFESLELVGEIRVVLPPLYFFPSKFSKQAIALNLLGFEEIFLDVNFHIDIGKWTQDLLSKGNRKKIRQFNEYGGEIVLASSSDFLNAYHVLRMNRENRGVKISMDQDRFVENLVKLPGVYRTYLAKVGPDIVGVAYLVRISDEVNYVLFWGDDINFRHLSPVASLLNFLVSESRRDGCTILDLGISSVDGVVDVGLARFKKNLGAVETSKPVYHRSNQSD